MCNKTRGDRKMPLYEYECNQCGKIEEALQKFSDEPLTTCRHCSGKLHKLISQSSFHLKGSGWYVTDYANKSRTNTGTAKKEAKESKESTAKTDEPAKTADKTS
jgi:putative FmdB family regulatory protein